MKMYFILTLEHIVIRKQNGSEKFTVLRILLGGPCILQCLGKVYDRKLWPC